MRNKVDEIKLSKYIIHKMYTKGKQINHLKLQKLLFYIAAWHLVYTGELLFNEEFQAWLHGPVLKTVWDNYKKYSVLLDELPDPGDVKLDITEDQEEIIEDVLDEYGSKSGYYLECLTHAEAPWKDARKKGENSIISYGSILKYYSELLDEEK